MRNGQLSFALLTLILLVGVSCQDNQLGQETQPKPKKSHKARIIAPAMSYNQWDNALSSIQQYWFDQHGGSSLKNDIYNDEQRAATDLNSQGMSMNVSIEYPLFCYQVALLGAYHTKNIGAQLADDWVQMTYADPTNFPGDVMYNFDIGKRVAQQFPSAVDMSEKVYNEMFISNLDYKVPGVVYLRTYQGVKIYRNPFTAWGSATFPGGSRSTGAIFLHPDEENDLDLTKHEFGHILQAEQLGRFCYWDNIAPKSIKSAGDESPGYLHRCFYTETDANKRSKLFHDQNGLTPASVNRFPLFCSSYDNKTPCQ